ncbi:ABC transporter ATP-binding protein [Niallia taxi]|uniref:ABC transporter ATP-binding protein n=1 Tax=Niallia taxi TaxID=2499688 RepID=UPI002E1AECF9|nr:ABC transporter ATP-binding protein [Niallia taxi]
MEFKELSFSYDDKAFMESLEGKIEHNKITTIIGPNGCGKSTLLSLLARGQKHSTGSITLDGKDIYSYKHKDFARKIAMVNQTNHISEDMTVEELIQFGRIPYKKIWKQENDDDKDAIEWALECTNLQNYKDIPVSALSGGQRQRVWIALALAQKTEILFLDEPTTYLDIYHQLELLSLIRELNQVHGITIVMVLHDMNQALRYSDMVIVMKSGAIKAYGPPKQVITQEKIKEIYDVHIAVNEDDKTGLYIVPLSI